MNTPLHFLDSFPKEILDNVLRYISGIPHAKNWEMHLDLRNLVELIAVRGELGSFVKSRFKTLCVSTRKDGENETEERDGPYLWTNSMAVARKYILAGGGESLETLFFGKRTYKKKRDGVRLIKDFVKHCPNVTSLSVVEKGSLWVNAFGKQLEKLQLRTDFPIKIPAYSTKLRVFTLNTHSNGDIPTKLWQRIGSSLEKVNLHGFRLTENEFGDIKENCRNLKYISVKGEDNEEKAAIANLLATYGGQLEYALLFKMDEVHLKEVADACPNARFHLETEDMGALFTSLNMLGPRLDCIVNMDFEIMENVDEWKNAWSKATTLRKLDICLWGRQHAEAIFHTPKEHLKELSMWICIGLPAGDVKKVMDACGKGTKCVEKFSYSGDYFNRDSAKTFLEQNRNSLSSIAVWGTPRWSYAKLIELIISFLELPALEKVSSDYEIPADTLNALKKRGVHWVL